MEPAEKAVREGEGNEKMICPICHKGTEGTSLLAHVRHKHTDYETHLEAAGKVSHLVHREVKNEYNKIAVQMLREVRPCQTARE